MTIVPQKHLGDCRKVLPQLQEKSIHLCVTSPPYWGLRSYLPAGHPDKPYEIGSEQTLKEYIAHIVEAFQHVRRVLRDDGSCWINLGDSYANDGKWGGESGGKQEYHPDADRKRIGREKRRSGLSPKNLCMVPQRVALALQEDGWTVRSIIPWLKRNPLPESCEDRPGSAVEYFIYLAKGQDCYYDRHAVMLKCSAGTHARISQATIANQRGGSKQDDYRNNEQVGKKSRDRTPNEILRHMAGVNPKAAGQVPGQGNRQNYDFAGAIAMPVTVRNRRNSDWFFESWQGMWLDDDGDPLAFIVNPVGTKIKHYASYPPKLVEPIILACTSPRCCADCGAPWERVTTVESTVNSGGAARKHAAIRDLQGETGVLSTGEWKEMKTTGWQPGCECYGEFVKETVVIPARMSKEDVGAWGADSNGEYNGENQKDYAAHKAQKPSDIKSRIIKNATEDRTVTVWAYKSPMLLELHPVVAATVLDPFGGTGTTCQVATDLGRHSVMCDISPEYLKHENQRDIHPALALL